MSTLLAASNVIFFGLWSALQLVEYSGCRETWCWVRLALGCLGAYWAGLYACVLVGILPPGDYLHPAWTMTGGLLAAAATSRIRSHGGFRHLLGQWWAARKTGGNDAGPE